LLESDLTKFAVPLSVVSPYQSRFEILSGGGSHSQPV
jgi:hypothetical protein